VQPIGLLTLTADVTNFFAETEQVAFHVGNLVPGIDVTDDPLLQTRLFSYVDTQLTRLGGPNFSQIPINRPHAPVNDMFRDGFHQHGVHAGAAPYKPNSLDGGCPFVAGAEDRPFTDLSVVVAEGRKVREAPASYDDHFSQVRLFWKSMTPVEQEHIVLAYTFELGKCYEQAIKERQLVALANIDERLCARVADGLGLQAPSATIQYDDPEPSPALSQVGEAWPPDGRMIGIVTDADSDLDAVKEIRRAIQAASMVPLVIAPHGGMLDDGLPVQRTFSTGRSVEFDALLVAGAAPPAPDAMVNRDSKAGATGDAAVDPRVVLLLEECFRHAKPIGAWGAGRQLLEAAGIAGAGVVIDDDASAALDQVRELLGRHRVWQRFFVSADTSPTSST
jgi:catalase